MSVAKVVPPRRRVLALPWVRGVRGQGRAGPFDPAELLGESTSLGIAVGFDSGDFVLVGRLVKSGLVPLD